MINRITIAFTLLTVICLTSSCGTIRMQYDARVKAEDGKVADYHYEKSYDLANQPAICALTGIFFGGACWFYLAMPNTKHEDAVIADANDELKVLLKDKKYELSKVSTDKRSWSDQKETSSLNWR